VLFDEPERDAALEHLAGRSLHAPSLLDFELANVAVVKSRASAGESARLGIADHARLDIALHGCPPDALVGLALEYRLTAYDAAYLWLAAHLRAPLATFDRRLGEAARRHLSRL
jgi:predicted nucleic acid-binding protein